MGSVSKHSWQIKRRHVLAGLMALPWVRAHATTAPDFKRVRPGEAGWPSESDWAGLRQSVGGRLSPVSLPSLNPEAAKHLLADPFYLSSQPSLTQVSAYVGAWRSSPSAYVVNAASAADVSAAVRFAAAHRLRVVVKGGGHSYMGGSNAPDSLLIWTHAMDSITLHDDFVPAGSAAAPVKAVSVGAGCLWLHAYNAVTTQAGRYVQGGGCTSVGVAGLVQGGGFGSWSKQFGIAAASLLEAEIVTADGTIRVVNAAQEPDLLWALRGGGGGTFGVVTRLTLCTHDLPDILGAMHWTVRATSDAAYQRLLAAFVDHYATHLFNPHWGEQARANRHNELSVEMAFQGLTDAQARADWSAILDFVAAHPNDFQTTRPFLLIALPARHMWDEAFLLRHLPPAIAVDDRPGARPGDYWWNGDSEQAGATFVAYTSAWLPARLLEPANQPALVQAWFNASRHWGVSFHFNKGLAGGHKDAIAASRETAMNPDVLDAFTLAIIAADDDSSFPALPKPDLSDAADNAARVQAAMRALRAAAPDTGNYMSECDYFEPDWQTRSWGAHASRLRSIKRQYDPEGLFFVHHGVGSEAWSPDGFTRLAEL
jgi:FAD/FMN-containing dehydrogenase